MQQALKKHSSPHDHFIKGILKFEEALLDFPKVFLGSKAVVKNLKLEPASYIDERLAATHSDLLFSCRFNQDPAFLYLLFEHQMKVPPKMPLRTTGYSFRIIDDWEKAHPRSKTIPAVIPIVFYQGKRPWRARTQLLEITDLSSKLKEQFRPVLLSSGFLLFDLNKVDIENLRCGLLLKLSLTLMKATARDAQFEWLQKNANRLNELMSKKSGPELLRLMLTYIFHTQKRTKASTWRDLADKVPHTKIKRGVMTIAEGIKKEGRQEGWRQGQDEGRRQGREEGILMGEIRLCESLLAKPVRSLEKLARLSKAQLQSELKILREQVGKIPA